MNRGDRRPIIYIMLSGNYHSSPTLPPTLYFSVQNGIRPLCPPIF